MEGVFWLFIVVVMAVIEIITLGLTTIWFAGGALVAFVASLLGANLAVQVALFVVVSVGLLALTRPLAVKFLNKGRESTNAESLIGKKAVVKQEIDNLNARGQVSVNGQEWTARSLEDKVIKEGKTVEIAEISGVKLMVRETVE
ncbi:MAG: NfeD family protein [Lachnospiraceae bacterium]|nr:NfeD family protein [Lachnospiraceae bacterium]